MELDALWENVFSEDVARVQSAWNSLGDAERASVLDFLRRVVADDERSGVQRAAARFALGVVDDELPAGALDFARQLAHDTGQFLLKTHGQLTASLKRDGSLVTQSDLESDKRLSAAITERFPGHVVMSEERDKVYRGQEWCWLIDPIDGTTNFTWGFPAWGVLIALLHWGRPVLGVADFPVLSEQYSAARGCGAWLNGVRLHTAQVPTSATGPEPMKTQLFACCTRSLAFGKFNLPLKVRIPGTTGYDMASVARGACVGSIDVTMHVWDVAAVWPILEEAGGVAQINRNTPLFPLQSGVDYAEEDYSIISACSEPMLRYLLDRLSDRFTVKPD